MKFPKDNSSNRFGFNQRVRLKADIDMVGSIAGVDTGSYNRYIVLLDRVTEQDGYASIAILAYSFQLEAIEC